MRKKLVKYYFSPVLILLKALYSIKQGMQMLITTAVTYKLISPTCIMKYFLSSKTKNIGEELQAFIND